MIKNLDKQISAVRQKLEEVKSETTSSRNQLSEKIRALINLTPLYIESWEGDWVEDTDTYRASFNVNSTQLMEVDKKMIQEDLKTKSGGIDIDEVRERIVEVSERFFDFREFVLSEFSFILSNENFTTEVEFLKQIEDFKWGMPRGEYIRSQKPRFSIVSDPSIINRPPSAPPHISISDDLLVNFSLLDSYSNFEKLVNRLLRSLELKSDSSNEEESGAIFQNEALYAIINRFHIVATQLRNRRENRATIIIEDEYDVQDLMYALLKINFEDVRKEENTPSLAGSSSRFDFLLKREKTVIEIKKTRNTLKDKEVGNELLLDIMHYKSHPDCKRLICFVYDPDSLIVNPRGIEDDLNKHTSDELIVEVYVKP